MEVINTNIMSLTAQNNLTKSQSSLATAMDQLSSGLRITSAASDAAGMAIATGFTTQINGLNQAIQNANNGLSLTQTAGSALSSITANLQRIRQLAVESANATNSSANRQQINQEVQQRLAEITRVSSQTTFNGQHILDGTFGQAAFQVGANVGQTITVNMTQGSKATQMGSIATINGGTAATGTTAAVPPADSVTGVGLSAGDLTMALANGSSATVAASSNFVGSDSAHGAGSAYAIAGAINGANLQGVTAVASDSQTFGVADVTATGVSAATTASYQLTINGVNVLSQSVNFSASASNTVTLASTQTIVNSVNAATGQTGVTAALDVSGKLVLSSADGGNISVAGTVNGGTGAATMAGGLSSSGSTTYAQGTLGTPVPNQYYGAVTVYSQQTLTLTGAGLNQLGLATVANSSTSQNYAINAAVTLANQNVDTVAASNQTIFAVDSALATINSLQANLGAVQNRFSSAIGNQTTVVQNLTQARSRIQDANFASATADLSRAQVLQQAGISVLAQANQMPQLALKLLR